MMKVLQDYKELTNSVSPSEIAKDTLHRMHYWDLRGELKRFKRGVEAEDEEKDEDKKEDIRNNLEKWHIEPAEVKQNRILAMGAFANVHLGEWLRISVAVKKLKCKTEDMTDTMTTDFDQEVNLWYRLSHPHIVNLYGASRCPPYPLFILEYASNGTLGSSVKKIPKDDRWSLLYESALGLQGFPCRLEMRQHSRNGYRSS